MLGTTVSRLVRSKPRDLAGRRFEVLGIGRPGTRAAGRAIALKNLFGKPTLHVVAFDDGTTETMLLQKTAGGDEHKFYVLYNNDR